MTRPPLFAVCDDQCLLVDTTLTSGSHWKFRWVIFKHASSLLLVISSGEKIRKLFGLSSTTLETYSPILRNQPETRKLL